MRWHAAPHGARQGPPRPDLHDPLPLRGGDALSQCAARIAAATGSGYFACQNTDGCTAHAAAPGASTRGSWMTGPCFELDELAQRLAGGSP